MTDDEVLDDVAPRVSVVSRIFVPEPAAASFRLAAMVSALVGAGARVDVLTVRTARARLGQRAGARVSDTESGARVRRWPVLRDASGVVRGYVQYLSFDVPVFFRLVLGPRVDVVVSEPPPTTAVVVRLACLVRGIPYVSYAPDIWSDAAAGTGAPRLLLRLLALAEGWSFRGASRVLAVSEQIRERLESMGVARSRVDVVSNGADTRTFTPDGPAKQIGRYFVYAGTASEWQGAEVFVEAMRAVRERYPDVSLVFVGQGSAWEQLRASAAGLGDGAVRFVLAVPAAEAAEWVRGSVSALVSLRPGLGYDFAFPTKVFAAAACGVPVVFAGVGPARDVVRDANLGLVVDHDVSAVTRAMLDQLERDGSPARLQAERRRLAGWARRFGSLERSSAAAARSVLQVAAGHAPSGTRRWRRA